MIKLLLLSTAILLSPTVVARGGGGHGGGGHSVGHVSAHSEGHSIGHSEAHVSKFTGLRTMSLSDRNTIIPQATSRFVPIYRHTSTSNSTESDPLLVTVCTNDELARARKWQDLCKEDDGINSEYCSLLSYFRYCRQADLDDVQGLVPASTNYHNVYVDSSAQQQ